MAGSEYLNCRKKLLEDASLEFLGPQTPEELLYEDPVNRYAAGILFPKGYESRSENATADELVDAEGKKVADVDADADSSVGEGEQESISQASSFYPSVMGLSFYCAGTNPKLNVEVSSATYRRAEPGEIFVETGSLPENLVELQEFKENFTFVDGKIFCKDGFPTGFLKELKPQLQEAGVLDQLNRLQMLSRGAWKRLPLNFKITVDARFKSQPIADGLVLFCNRRTDAKKEATLFTIALKNSFPACAPGSDTQHIFFQNEIKIVASPDEKKPDIFIEYGRDSSLISDDEEKSLSLLYRHKKHFAVGHGCAVDWEKYPDNDTAVSLVSRALPTYEVPQVEFKFPGPTDPAVQQVLSMRFLSDIGAENADDMLESLRKFCGHYEQWIDERDKIVPSLQQHVETARKHIDLCRESAKRMLHGVEILKNEPEALKAFRLANRSILIQGLQSEWKQKRVESKEEVPASFEDFDGVTAKSREWRPFQLAFILLSIRGAVDNTSEDRDLVDLIWFPTGGGKTEAYLGLSAFVAFYRRIKYAEAGNGTAVIMRYTLRLLTSQQFQRAATLICAMEQMRQESPELGLGDAPFTIGLWVGLDATPNTVKDAEERFKKLAYTSSKAPSPILACPWCGTALFGRGNKPTLGYKIKMGPKRIILNCPDRKCPFNDQLPVEFIDEQIYKNPTTILFGTVDKFAQLPWKEGVAPIFALDAGNPLRSPELIIQDELHLISGALGTLVALYETAIDFFCAKKGVRPKVIASTATVRRAGEQCRNLFDRDVRQFPQPALDAEDSFFARETPLTNEPGRLYIGMMASGRTQTTALVRLSAALLQSQFNLTSEDAVKDKYWTLASYFNSIRELGGYVSLLLDDIPSHQGHLTERYGGFRRYISNPQELTSRTADEIPKILEKLYKKYPDKGAIDVLSATNMISVGVDIERLNVMTVRGQPKTASEYIQATSRVGRKYPGIVFTLFNTARSRDRAHFERFITFHQSFYRYVEPSSITPFSAPARSRALHAILVAMVRHASTDGGRMAHDLKEDDAEVLAIRKFILDRVRSIDQKEEANTSSDIAHLLLEWKTFVDTYGTDVGFASLGKDKGLLKAREGKVTKWDAPTSMRNVDEVSCVEFIND